MNLSTDPPNTTSRFFAVSKEISIDVPLLAEMAIGQLFCGGEEGDEDVVVGGDVGSDKEIAVCFFVVIVATSK